MKYLVLGSAGLIGSNLVNFIREKGHEAFTWDIATNPWEDLRVRDRVDSQKKNIDFVFFLAFDVGGSSYLKTYQNTYTFIDNNIKLMDVTFECLKKYNTPFLFTSSQMSNLSFSSYGNLKSIGEFYTNSLNGLVTKFWNVYGIENYDNPTKNHVISDFINMALTTKEIYMKTDGSEYRQFLYITDCCEGLLTLANNYDNISRTESLHITSFKWHRIIDIATIISNIIGNVRIIPGFGNDPQFKIKNEANDYILNFWQPKIDIKEGIEQIVKHYKLQLS